MAVSKYGTEDRLLNNQLYTITLTLQGEQTSFSFTSSYNPLYSSVQLIRGDFRQLFSLYTDDHINRLIYDNSLMALEISDPEILITTDPIPYYVKQYVRYKTEIDLVIDLLITTSMSAGSQEKLLGDMKIVKETKTPMLDDILKLLQGKLAPWETELIGMKGKPLSGVRAGTNFPYPIDTRLF